ncbi:MAG: ABC transporter ATP-binding protein, partial [Acetobacteraceae bacterium]|nr:ABC transporter ATP-binding protein [Acetobacteraceae bacterium]
KRRLVPIWGQPPDLIAPPAGCRFNPRCDWAMKVCLEEPPPFYQVGPSHRVACWLMHPMAPKTVGPRKGAAQ